MRTIIDLRNGIIPEKLPFDTDVLVTQETQIDNIQFRLSEDKIFQDSVTIGKRVTVASADEMQQLMKNDFQDLKLLLLETGDWKIIPIENLIAKLQALGIELWCVASTVEEVKLLQEILEIGVDAVVIPLDLKDAVEELGSHTDHINLEEVTVTSIEKIGSGDRVCVDTTAMLQPGEGMLIGATSKVFVLLEAEVHESGYVNARPFRVNAGPVSAYILNNEKTNYLSELEAGVRVSVVSRDGSRRSELVGRVKIERRPLLLIKVQYEDQEYPIIVQDAETVRLMTTETSIPVHELSTGAKVLANVEKLGRHFGMPVDEFIEER